MTRFSTRALPVLVLLCILVLSSRVAFLPATPVDCYSYCKMVTELKNCDAPNSFWRFKIPDCSLCLPGEGVCDGVENDDKCLKESDILNQAFALGKTGDDVCACVPGLTWAEAVKLSTTKLIPLGPRYKCYPSALSP